MPRRYADYLPNEGFTTLNQISTVGAFILGVSMVPFVAAILRSRPIHPEVHPWGLGRALEWATTSPPPRSNFHRLPPIRSDSPAFDLHHPEIGGSDPDIPGVTQELVSPVHRSEPAE